MLVGRRGFQEPQFLEEVIAAHLNSSINELVHKARCMALQEWLHLPNQDQLIQPAAAQTSDDIGFQNILVPPGSPEQLSGLLAHPGPQRTEDIRVFSKEGRPFLRQEATHSNLGHWLCSPMLILLTTFLCLCAADNPDLQKVIF